MLYSGYTDDYLISNDDVLSAICRLKPSKNDGDRGLSTIVILYMAVLGFITLPVEISTYISACMPNSNEIQKAELEALALDPLIIHFNT